MDRAFTCAIVDRDTGPDTLVAEAAGRGGRRKLPKKNSKKIESSAQKVAISDEVAQAAVSRTPSRA